MHKVRAFTERNTKEILRDPLSYIFCLGFPLVMLVIMTLINESIPSEVGMTIFRIDRLSGGIAIFGQMFIMLFMALSVAKDRNGAFLVRMYATPMTSGSFTLGYILPMVFIAIMQSVITYAASWMISLFTDVELHLSGLLVSTVSIIPSAVLFIAFGLFFGTIFNEKTAPGMCSILISLGSFLGGIWFDSEATGGVMETICKCLPFLYCVKTARSAIALEFGFEAYLLPLLLVIACAAAMTALSSIAFRAKMKADLA